MKSKNTAGHFALIITVGALTACGAVEPYQPMVDSQSIASGSKYQQDVRECRSYAQQTKPASNLWLHVLSGDKRGLEKKNEKFESTFQRCMAGRGYSVLG